MNSNEALQEIRSKLETSGVLILDAHERGFDMIRTIMFLRRNFPSARIIVPQAGYLSFSPLWKFPLRAWNSWYRIDAYPVFRRVDETTQNSMIRRGMSFVPTSMTREVRHKANEVFLQIATAGVGQENTIVVVAPYKGPVWFGQKVAFGAQKLAEVSSAVYVSRTRPGLLGKTRIAAYVATPLRRGISNELLLQQFTELAD